MKIRLTTLSIVALFVFGVYGDLNAQGSGIDVSQKTSIKFKTDEVTQEQMDQINAAYHEHLVQQDPKWDQKRNAFEQQIQDYIAAHKYEHPDPTAIVTIPVVVHVLWQTTAQNISDNQVFSQIIVVNQDHNRTNPDASQTPAAWSSTAANTGIQFCLAQRDPSGNATTGIERRQTTVASFSANDACKHFSSGGLDAWDPSRYLNIWVCNLGSGLLGYGEFPTGSVSQTFGVVILYSAFGSNFTTYGAFSDIGAPYDRGRTTTHEFSHCLNLYHIWGDDGTSCSGSDQCADTPNQAGATSSCFTYPHTDACTTTNPGIMFYNYMDYSFDNCLNLFTHNQSTRMNAVLSSTPYSSLTTSNGCQSVNLSNNDAGILSITAPNGTICSGTFTPVVVLKNYGANTLTSCKINYKIDAQTALIFNWTGSLATNGTANVTLPSMTTTGGAHTFTAFTTLPNNVADTQSSNDQTIGNFTVSVSGQTLPYSYGFEPTTFPPTGWTLLNPDGSNTWVRTTQAFKTGTASAKMDNFTYQTGVGQRDQMKLLPLNLTTVTNPTLKFQVAYVYYIQTNPSQNFTDSLRVSISTNCGATWTSMYYKGGVNLATATPVANTNNEFVPTNTQWRQETISLAPYASSANAIIMFSNNSQYGDQMYIDDINISGSTSVDEQDLGSYVSMFPNPSTGEVFVNLALPSSENVEIRIYDVVGQTIATLKQNDVTSNSFNFNLGDKTNGVYFVEIKTAGNSITRKLILNK